MNATGALAGRRALVTGGTRGIGAAIAERLTTDGAEVIVTGTHLDGSAPNGCDFRAVDFADDEATAAFAEDVTDLNLGILVNNAGINKIAPFEEIDPSDFDRIQRVNVRAPFLLCRAVLPSMRRSGWGRIVNISSIFGTISKEHRGSYSASKFALDGMTAALAAEVAVDGVLANCVSPGFIDTDLTRTILGEQGMAELAARVPAARLGAPDEVAALVAWLVSPENTYLTGQNVVIDGGFSRI
ncbi:MAG TPA: SDR family oxidoreductase [Gaiellaceae bacterium]|nr:SDR family oxidoreductase [Gaiellaceae bacterium]